MIKLDYGIHAFGELLWFMKWLENVFTYIKTWFQNQIFWSYEKDMIGFEKAYFFYELSRFM